MFCCQQHNDSFPSKERLQGKLNILKDFILMQTSNVYKVNMMGGEIFSDEFPDDVFELYKWFLIELDKLLESKKVQYGITTNLLFNKTERVLEFIKWIGANYDFSLATSYDPKLRSWSNFQRDFIFKPNVELFKPWLTSVSTVLHKLTINTLLKEEDSYLTYLYNNFNLVFTWYVPKSQISEENNLKMIPSDNDCKSILFYLKNTYPNSEPIKQYIENENNTISCCSHNRLLIDAYNLTSNCLYLAPKYNQNEFKSKLDKDSISPMFETFINKNKCITCPHLKKCGFVCFPLSDFKNREQNTICFMKEFFDDLRQ